MVTPSFFIILARPPRPQSVFIIGWWYFNPRTVSRRSLDSVPLNLVYCFPRQTMVLVPPFSPLQYSPGFLSQCSLPVSSLFSSYCLLSVRFCSVGRPPPAAYGHPSSVRKNYTHLRLTVDQSPSPGFLSSVPYEGLPPPDLCVCWYLAWVWVEGRRRRRPPRWS